MNSIESMFQSYVAIVAAGQSYWVLVASYVVSLVLEILLYRFILRKRWSDREALPNLVSSAVGVVLDSLAAIVFGAAYVFVYKNYALLHVPITWWGFLLAYVGFEFCHYAQHRMQHRTGLFWAVHSVHHSSNEMNIPVSARFAWGIALTEPVYMLMPIFGFSLLHFRALQVLANVYGIWNHTKIIPKLGFLEHVLMTPANHRVHHGRQLKYLDRNYGQSLLLFDKLFKTHQLEEEPVEFGLVHQVWDRNPLRFQTHGYRQLWTRIRSATHWRDKLLYLIKPPGWSHTGNHETTRALIARTRSQKAAA